MSYIAFGRVEHALGLFGFRSVNCDVMTHIACGRVDHTVSRAALVMEMALTGIAMTWMAVIGLAVTLVGMSIVSVLRRCSIKWISTRL